MPGALYQFEMISYSFSDEYTDAKNRTYNFNISTPPADVIKLGCDVIETYAPHGQTFFVFRYGIDKEVRSSSTPKAGWKLTRNQDCCYHS